jgi:hypothetical protein
VGLHDGGELDPSEVSFQGGRTIVFAHLHGSAAGSCYGSSAPMGHIATPPVSIITLISVYHLSFSLSLDPYGRVGNCDTLYICRYSPRRIRAPEGNGSSQRTIPIFVLMHFLYVYSPPE